MNKTRPKTRTVDKIIDDKMKILEDFGIVNDVNYESIRKTFVKAVDKRSDSDPDIIVDRIAKTLFKEKIYH